MVDSIKQKFIDYVDGVIKSGKISHAYLIEVDNYQDDLIYVYNFIKMILTNKSYDEVIHGHEKVFDLIDSHNFPDLVTISSDTAMIKKDQMIDLKKEFSNTSLYGDKRFYIIEEAEKLNSSSANTILKFLEEPEEGVIAFLLTDSRYHVIDTILSRCQVLSLKSNLDSFVSDDYNLDFLDYIIHPSKYFSNYKEFSSSYIVDKLKVKELFINIENIIVYYINGSTLNNLDDDNISYLLKKTDINYLISVISIIEEYLVNIKFNVNLKLWFDAVFCKLLEV